MSLDSILDRLAGQPVIRRRKKRLRPARFIVETLENRALLAGFTVNSTSPGVGGAGANTLLDAIGLANADTGDSNPFVINFDIPTTDPGYNSTTGVWTINVLALPTITHPVTINGETQSGWSSGHPVIDIDGIQATSNTQNGLVFTVGGNTVQGLIINNFQAFGIVLDGTNDLLTNRGQGPGINNTIQGNFLGTDAGGQNAAPNGAGAIDIFNSSYNLIGGLNANGQLTDGNLISGNGGTGVYFGTGTDSHNYVEGNYIGTDLTGLKPLPNKLDGVALVPPADTLSDGFASNNVIGDFDPNEMQFDPNGRNIISGNTNNGVYIVGGTGNQVVGNYIGLGSDGGTRVGNGEDGVRLEDASSNTVGGTQPGAGNVISANLHNGVEIVSDAATEQNLAIPVAKQGASGNIVLGNYIGTDATGKLDTATIPGPVGPQIVPLGNARDGVVVANNSSDPSVSILNNVIGGQNTNGQLSVGNLISGNLDDGVLLAGPRVTVNTVAGNYIGTDKSGTQSLANASAGVELNVAASQMTGAGPSKNLIGGVPGDGNVISGNGTPAQGTNAAAGEGVLIANGSNANILEGNYIGTTASGLAPLANVNGVLINNAANNVVGDFNNDNVISGNTVEGILITGSQATGNYVQNNRIGTAQDFSTSIPNQDGVVINNQAAGNFVGNVVTLTSGSIALLGNTIAGNTGFGVQIAGGAANNQVMANGFGIVEGIDLRRGTPQAGNGTGVQILDSASNIIGGTTANARNFIDNSLTDGVNIQDTNGITGSGTVVTTGNVVEGDYMGVGNDGSTKLANGGNGISIDSAVGNTIGGNGQGAGNVISGSALSGVVIDGMAATGNKVAGNDIGTSADGTTAVPNLNGVEIENGATLNFVGLAGDAGRNIISGNSAKGVWLSGAGQSNYVQNNYIGLNAQGTAAPTNSQATSGQTASSQTFGVEVDNSQNTFIGGIDPSLRNVVSGNSNAGIAIGSGSSGTQIVGNYVGTDNGAANAVGQQLEGILVTTNHGSSLAPPANVTISGNIIGGAKVGIELVKGTNNDHVLGNYIGENATNVALPNLAYGIWIDGSSQNWIGGTGNGRNFVVLTQVLANAQSPFTGSGIRIDTGASQNHVLNNVIEGNQYDGIDVDSGASNNFIGAPGLGNTISLNQSDGIEITGSGTNQNKVQANLIGLETTGLPGDSGSPEPNAHGGIDIADLAAGNIIGGQAAGSGNVISANPFGVILNTGASGNSIVGNLIGTTLKGTVQQGFGNGTGIQSQYAGANTIGGPTSSAGLSPGNKILGNGFGITFFGGSTTVDGVQYTDKGGSQVQGNEIAHSTNNGIVFKDTASNVVVGGSDKADGNSIHDNGGNGIVADGIYVESGVGDSIQNNLIFNNTGLGIHLIAAGAGNDLLASPHLSLATTGSSQRLSGWLQGLPNALYFIEFFSGSQDPSNNGAENDDAEQLLIPLSPTTPEVGVNITPAGTVTLATNSAGTCLFDLNWSSAAPLTGGTTVIRAIATAVDSISFQNQGGQVFNSASGDTSQFSNAVVVSVDSDGDGEPDSIEANAPSGVPKGPGAVTFQDAVMNPPAYVTLEAPQATDPTLQVKFQDAWSVPMPAPPDNGGPPQDTVFPFGFASFTLTNTPATPQGQPLPFVVTMILPGTATPPTSYWRYGKTPDNQTNHWYDWLYGQEPDGTGAEFRGNLILLHFLDGGFGDDDLNPNNRTIVDSGSPGFPGPYTVTTTADSGLGSLRQAIENANANPGSTIMFDLPATGPQTIQPLSPLPAITADVTIDGSTQAGFAGTPLVVLDGSQAGAGADGLDVESGAVTMQDLVVDHFSGDGIRVSSSASATIGGNYIGTDASGKVAAGNGLYGVQIEDTSTDPDGDGDNDEAPGDNDKDQGNAGKRSTVDAGNVISGNTAGGISILGNNANATIKNNFIGTQADGLSPLGNSGPGIVIDGGSTGNTIGDDTLGDGNTIAYNAGAGVDIVKGTLNLIQGNSIFANQGLGIEVASGQNGSQSAPVLASTASYGGQTFVSGTLNSVPSSSFTIDFYATDPADQSGGAQGQSFLGSTSVNTDSSGQASFDLSPIASAAPGTFITATASLVNGQTSTFSAPLTLTPTNPLVLIVNTTDDVNDAVPDPTHFSLREAILAANAHPGQDIIDFDLPNNNRVIQPQSALPTITDPVIIDGTSQPGYQGLPLVEINGSQAGTGVDGLTITGGGSVVRGLGIDGFVNDIALTGPGGGNQIQACFLGTDITGTSAGKGDVAGVKVENSRNNTIGGTTAAQRNVAISIVLDGAATSGNVVEGNYITTDLTGTALLLGAANPLNSNTPTGVLIADGASSNTIGGATAGVQNVIAAGITILSGNSNIVQGNLIGTDVTGTQLLDRLFVNQGAVDEHGQQGIVVDSDSNVIGGTLPGDRNIVTNGIGLYGNQNVVQGNYIGTDITGTISLVAQLATATDAPLGYLGITIFPDGVDVWGNHNLLGGSALGAGNLISGFATSRERAEANGFLGAVGSPGVDLAGQFNSVEGNLIGTDATGTKALPNNTGVLIGGPNVQENQVGGTVPGAGNVISGNQTIGIDAERGAGTVIQGNYVGTDRTGTKPLGNGLVTGYTDGFFGVIAAMGIEALSGTNVVIGGSQPGAGNVISANGGPGIAVGLPTTASSPRGLHEGTISGLTIEGNYIGLDATGRAPLGNAGDGIEMLYGEGANAMIGGALAGADNVISANGGDGIHIDDNQNLPPAIDSRFLSDGVNIQGNKIGTDVTGTEPVGNALDGISIITSVFGTSDETVGGVQPGAGNLIAYNGGNGVDIPAGNGNAVRGNDIFDNGGLGLITNVNDAAASYAENRGIQLPLAAPVLTAAVFDPQGTVVSGSLTGAPFTRYEIDLFSNDAVNPTGFGDGQTYLQSISVLVDDSGSVQFQIPLDAAVPVGKWITATATPDTTDGNTSMFSQPTPVIAAAGNTVQFASPNDLVTETGGAAVIVVTRSGDTSGMATVDYATNGGAAAAGVNYTAESGTLTFAAGVTSETITVPIADDGQADGNKDFHILLSNASGASLGVVNDADVTIADSDSAGQIQFARPTESGDSGSAGFTVTRTGGTQGTVTVEFAVTGGTALSNATLLAATNGVPLGLSSSNAGTVTFAPGQTTATIAFGFADYLDLTGDPGPLTVELTLGNPIGGATLGALTTSTLTFDDTEGGFEFAGAPNLSSEVGANGLDGGPFGNQVQIPVNRIDSLNTTETVSYTTVDGTAKAGTNYLATSGTLTFKPGQSFTQDIYVPVLGGPLGSTESFQVVLSNSTGGAVIVDGFDSWTVTILGTDIIPVTVAVDPNQSFDGHGSSAAVTVERQLANPAGQSFISGSQFLSVSTSDGTAKAGTDYQAVSDGQVEFQPGQSVATFSVPLLPNSQTTGSLTFNVTLSGGASPGEQIESNPVPITLTYTPISQFASPGYPVAENSAELTVTVLGRPLATVDYATHDGTAIAGTDYTAVSGTLTFGASGTATITIPILNNQVVAGDKTFSVVLGDAATTTVTIFDVGAQSTTKLTSSAAGGSTYGQAVTFTAMVTAGSGTPTGSVDFVDTTTGEDLGSPQLAVVNGVEEASVTVSSLVAGSQTIVATYTSDNNIAGSHDLLIQTIAPATLTVTADNKTMVSGATVPPLTDTITGFINGDTSSVVTGAASLSTTATSASGAGSYTITAGAGTLSAANYTFTFVNGTLTVTAGGNTPVLTLVHDSPAPATEGSSATLTSTLLETSDSDSSVAASAIVYTMTTAPTLGTLADDGNPLGVGGKFSQQDINDGIVTYQSTEEGADSFAFSVAGGGAAPISGTLAITASDPAVVATGGFTYSAIEGSQGAAQAVATFTDPRGAEALGDYAATIDWGDGTSATASTLSVDPNTHVFTVSGAHTYAQDGTFLVTVTVAHESAPAVRVTSTAGITSATGTGEGGIAAAGAAVSGYEFSALTGVTVATFTDTDVSLTASDFSAVIDWGDGTTSAGTVTVSSGNAGETPTPQYSVTGSHEYLDEGHYTIEVSISETAGPVTGSTSATVGATATIHEQLLANGAAGTPDQNYIQEIYRDLFGRQAEMQGLDYWVAELAQGVPRQQVAFRMVKIAPPEEFQHDTVAALYEQYLGRAPDAGGRAYWSAYLYDGGTIEGMSEALVDSQEFYQARGGGTVEGYLKALFQSALGRQIDPAALTYFEKQMSQGASAADVAETVFASDEYHRIRVNELFKQFLDRPADPGGLAHFAGELDSGVTDESVISQMLAADEYFAKAQV